MDKEQETEHKRPHVGMIENNKCNDYNNHGPLGFNTTSKNPSIEHQIQLNSVLS